MLKIKLYCGRKKTPELQRRATESSLVLHEPKNEDCFQKDGRINNVARDDTEISEYNAWKIFQEGYQGDKSFEIFK